MNDVFSFFLTAVNCVIVSLLIQQLILLFFNLIRGQPSDSSASVLNSRAIFSITMFTIFLGLFAAQVFFHIFKGFSPIQYTYQPMREPDGKSFLLRNDFYKFFCRFLQIFPVKSDFTNFLYINANFFDGFVFTFFLQHKTMTTIKQIKKSSLMKTMRMQVRDKAGNL